MFVILKRVKSVVHSHKPVKAAVSIGCGVAILFSVYTAGYVYLEGASVMEGVWQSWQTFTTVGYGNAPANTNLGRIFSMIFGTIGIAVMAVLIAIMSDMRQYFRDRRRLGFMENKMKDGYVIINWPGKPAATRIINQLRAEEPDCPLCFVDSDLEELPASVQALKDVHYYKGNLSCKDTYENANVRNNKAVIVFPKNPDDADVDISTSSVVKLVKDFINGDSRILYMLCNSENRWLFPEDTTPIMKNFWVFAMAQEITDNDSSSLIEKLVNNSDGESINSWRPQANTSWATIRTQLAGSKINPIGYKQYKGETHLLVDDDTMVSTLDTVFLACKNDQDMKEVNRMVFGS